MWWLVGLGLVSVSVSVSVSVWLVVVGRCPVFSPPLGPRAHPDIILSADLIVRSLDWCFRCSQCPSVQNLGAICFPQVIHQMFSESSSQGALIIFPGAVFGLYRDVLDVLAPGMIPPSSRNGVR